VFLGLLLLASGCRAESTDPASSELIREKSNERKVPELICLVQEDEPQFPEGAASEISDLPRCDSRIRDEFLRNLSHSSARSEWAEVADIPKKGRYYWGFLPGIEMRVFIRAVSHGPNKDKPTHYIHPSTDLWTEI
jgi:hypothetical protein